MVDGFLQDAYNHFHEGPLIQNVEQVAASVCQAARLSLVTGKLVGKQTLRVVKKQIDRNGGVGSVLENVGHMTLDRVTHPVETIGMMWNGVNWGIDRAKDTLDQIVSVYQDNSTIHNLQQ